MGREEGINSGNNFYIVHASLLQSYSQKADSNHSCFTLWLGFILNIAKLKNKGGAKGWDNSLPIVALIRHLLNEFII